MIALKTRQQIAEELGIDRKTLYNKLKQANVKLNKGLLTPEEQKVIFELFGKRTEALEEKSVRLEFPIFPQHSPK